MSAWYKEVTVVAGPAFCQGKIGYVDETVGMVYFDPAHTQPTRDTDFGSAYLECLLTCETIKQTGERRSGSKAKSDVEDAFKT